MSASRLTPTLYVGTAPTSDDVHTLKDLGITHVLDVGWPHDNEPEVIRNSFVYLDNRIDDDGEPKPRAWFDKGIQFADSLRAGDKLLVHCRHGVNRSPAMAYAILRSEWYDPDSAEEVVRLGRPQTGTGSTGHWFKVYIDSYEGGA